MRSKALPVLLVLIGCVGVLPAHAGDEDEGFRTELEFNYGYLVGDDLNNLAGSFVEKSYGGRLSFGFNRVLNPELQYGYSDRTSNLFQPTLIFTTWAIQSNNWNWFSFSNPIHLYKKRGKVFYISPGVGYVRSGSRQFQEISASGTATASLPIDSTRSFDLGIGTKLFPVRRVGVRLDVTGILTSASSGSLQPVVLSDGTAVDPNQIFPNGIPGRSHIRFTAGLIIRLR